MFTGLIILIEGLFIAAIALVYYAFFRQPNQLKKLSQEINSALITKKTLDNEITRLENERQAYEKGFVEFMAKMEETQNAWNKLSNSVAKDLDVAKNKKKTLDEESIALKSESQRIQEELQKMKSALALEFRK